MSAMDTGPAEMKTIESPRGEQFARVVSISGAQLVALLDAATDETKQTAPNPPQIGELVAIATRGSTVFGMVTGLNIPLPDNAHIEREMRIIEVELIGEIERGKDGAPGMFQNGVAFYPSLNDPICRATKEDLQRVFVRPELKSVRIGALHQDRSVPAFISPNELLGKHFAVLGTPGSGKSCATATILRAILGQRANAHMVILDPHNEYSTAFADVAEVISPQNLSLPYWMLNFEELKELIIGNGSKNTDTDAIVLNEVVTQAKRNMQQSGAQKSIDASLPINIDTPVPYRVSDVTKIIDEILGSIDKPPNFAPYLRIKEKFHSLQNDRRYGFMFGGLTVFDNMAKILSRIFRVPVDGKPVTVIDISGMPSEVLSVVVTLLCRMTFDFALWSELAVPILLVCEEAHRYAPNADGTGFDSARLALSRIAKEGRKCGVSLCLVSPRPSELSTTVLSQCGTIFAMRLSNQKDQEFLAAALPESSTGLMGELPSLRNGEAIAVGEGVPVSARICLDLLPENSQPKSRAAPFSRAWEADQIDAEFLKELVNRWRRQR
jgi:DNA helicase HerA-like ATPase